MNLAAATGACRLSASAVAARRMSPPPLPPSAACCAAFTPALQAGCFCSASVVAAGGADLQIASQFSAPGLCGGDQQASFQDGDLCFDPPSSLPPGYDPSGTPPVPSAPASPVIAPSAQPLQPLAERPRTAAREAGPVVGICIATALAVALALHWAVASAVAEMLSAKTPRCWLDDCAREPALIRPVA